MLDNARAPSTGDEAVGPAYLRLIFPYNMYVSYSDITLHVEEPGYEEYGQEEDWTQSQGQMSSSGSYPNMYTNWDFGFTSTEYHNGDWEASCTYHWKRYNMMLQVIEEGDASVDGYEFVVNNLVVTDAYDAETDSKNFLISQGDESPVVHAAITAHPYGGARDTITYKVFLRTLGPNASTTGPWMVTKTLAGTSDSIDITLDQASSGNPRPARGVYAFNVVATAYTAYTSGDWCDGLPEEDPDEVTVNVISSGLGDCTAGVDATYDIATVAGSSAKFEFFGPTTSSPDIALRNTITGGTAALGSNEKESMSLSVGVSDIHYLGVAILDEHTERYRSHTARWALASGWTAGVPAAALLKYHKEWEDYLVPIVDHGDAYTILGAIAEENAPAFWLYRGRWTSSGNEGPEFIGVAHTNDISKALVINSLANVRVWCYDGHGYVSGIGIAPRDDGTEWYVNADDIPDGVMQLGLVMCCEGASFAEALAEHNDGAFTVGPTGGVDGSLCRSYVASYMDGISMLGSDDAPHTLWAIHRYAVARLPYRFWSNNHDKFETYGSGSTYLSPALTIPVFQ